MAQHVRFQIFLQHTSQMQFQLLAIFFDITPSRRFAPFRDYVRFLPILHVRFFPFLQGNSVHVATCLAVTQGAMEMMVSLQAPLKSTCHLIINKHIFALRGSQILFF